MTIPDVARAASVSATTVRRWEETGLLKGIRLGGKSLRFDPAEVEDFLSGRQGGYIPEAELDRRAAARAAEVEPELSPVEAMAELIGISPRVASLHPELVDRYELVSPGRHVAAFAETYCRHTQMVPGGPRLGSPFRLESFQIDWLEEGLAVEGGRRVFTTLGLIEPRKSGKTSGCGMLSLYLGGPADGEHRPVVIQAAGSRKQAGELFDQTTAFVSDPRYGSDLLRRLYHPLRTGITCHAVSGLIERVAGDGDLNHSLNPHVVMADELHAWRTPKQRENWKALTSAQGARLDPLVIFMTTEGEGDDSVLAEMLERVMSDPDTEIEQRSSGLTVFRNRPARMLLHRWAIPESAELDDLDAFVAANPAPWRTRERLARDLADPMLDAQTKGRLYGNRRSQPARRWIATEVWARLGDPEVEPGDPDWIERGAAVGVGGDAAITHDTTAIGWASRLPDGRVRVRARVWSVRERVAYHVFVPGGRLDNEEAEHWITDELAASFGVQGVALDPRYLATEARHLSNQGLVVVELSQSSADMADAWQGFYKAVAEGLVVHDRDPVLAAHVKAAVGHETPRGWRVRKADEQAPIDALVAVVMAHWVLSADLPTPGVLWL